MKDLAKFQQNKISYFLMKREAKFEEAENVKIVRYVVEKSGKNYPACACFIGKSSKPVNNFYFHTYERMEQSIQEIIKRQQVQKERKEQRKKTRMDYIPQSKPGDIFVCSWGYDQTNIDFYLLLEVHGKTGIFIEIGSKNVEGTSGFDCCNVVADPSRKIGDIFRKQILPGEQINLASYKYCHKWDGREEYCSWYA